MNKFYVGVTHQDVYKRIRQHKRGKKQFIDKEINRIGWDGNWDWWIVEENVPFNLITKREQYWIHFLNAIYPNGYNQTIGGIKHFKHSKNTLEKMSKSHIGKKCAPFTEEHKANISKSRTGEKNPNYGKPAWNRGIPCTEDAKRKISEKLKGRKRPDQSEKMKGENNPNFGKPKTDEQKAKISKANKGKTAWNKGIPRSEETKAKISKAHQGKASWNKGIPCSEEQKLKISEANQGKVAWNKGIPCSEEVKAKIRATKARKKAEKEKAAAQDKTS